MRITAADLAAWMDPDGQIRLGTEGGVGLLVVSQATDTDGMTALSGPQRYSCMGVSTRLRTTGLDAAGTSGIARSYRLVGGIMVRELGLVVQPARNPDAPRRKRPPGVSLNQALRLEDQDRGRTGLSNPVDLWSSAAGGSLSPGWSSAPIWARRPQTPLPILLGMGMVISLGPRHERPRLRLLLNLVTLVPRVAQLT